MAKSTKRRRWDKGEYIRVLIKYKKERELHKANKQYVSPEYYKKRLLRLTQKISTYSAAIKRIDRYVAKLHRMNDRLTLHYHITVYKSHVFWGKMNGKTHFGHGVETPLREKLRWMFYRVAIDAKIPTYIIASFVGKSKGKVSINNILRARSRVAKYVKDDKKFNDLWKQFKSRMKFK